jgi:Ser/Thr protein kinase RdoA (MazF antagonist)
VRIEEVDDRAIARWCAMWLRARPAEILAGGGHLSRVSELLLANGRRVVVKVRPEQTRLTACTYVQRHLWRAGFPCPEPLVGPLPFGAGGELVASAEAYVPGGEMVPADVPGASQAYATLLARMLRLAPPAAALPPLEPSPPWNAWNHRGGGVWPPADDRTDDLNAIPETSWLDEVGRAVQSRLADYGPRSVVVGHGDFEAQNIRWNSLTPHVVHDWDSVIAGPEAVIVGFAAAAWPQGAGPPATIDETAEFLDRYRAVAPRAWATDDVEAAWAAGLWMRAFNEKKYRIDGVTALEPDEAVERLRRAGVTV